VNAAALWEGPDHLLLVESYRVSESYRRFYYRDIQALLVGQTRTWIVLAAIFGAIGMGFGLLALAAGSEAAIAFWVPAALFLGVALANLALGPTCRCTLRTAVQVHRLPALNRLSKARRVLRVLQARIKGTQQPIPAAE